jgi:ACR3 family arsenite efflux pump ArsB
MPDTLNGYLILVFLILPGFIGIKTKRFIAASESADASELILSCALFSSWNFFVMLWLINLILSEKCNFFFGSLGVILVAPVIQGVLLGFLERSESIYWIAEKLNILLDIKRKTVWDRAFFGNKRWVRVHMPNDVIYEGVAVMLSMGSDNKELLLKNVVVISPEGKKVLDLQGAEGVFVNANDVKVIEIYN